MSVSFQVDAEKVNVNLEEGTVIVTGVDLSALLGEFNAEEVLEALDFTAVAEYYIKVIAEDADE